MFPSLHTLEVKLVDVKYDSWLNILRIGFGSVIKWPLPLYWNWVWSLVGGEVDSSWMGRYKGKSKRSWPINTWCCHLEADVKETGCRWKDWLRTRMHDKIMLANGEDERGIVDWLIVWTCPGLLCIALDKGWTINLCDKEQITLVWTCTAKGWYGLG